MPIILLAPTAISEDSRSARREHTGKSIDVLAKDTESYQKRTPHGASI